MSHHGYGLAFDAMSQAAAECGVAMHQMADAVSKVKFTRTIKLHPSFDPIEVPIWAPIFRKKVRVRSQSRAKSAGTQPQAPLKKTMGRQNGARRWMRF